MLTDTVGQQCLAVCQATDIVDRCPTLTVIILTLFCWPTLSVVGTPDKQCRSSFRHFLSADNVWSCVEMPTLWVVILVTVTVGRQ